MAVQLTLEVASRQATGTGAAGRLRRFDDVVPGVVYGAGKDNVNVTLPVNVLSKAMQSDTFLSQIIDLKMDDNSEQVVVRELQRHPATDKVTHIDFMRVRADREIQVSVPIRFLNEEDCVGVRLGGGTITRNLIEVEISCLPRNLPEAIEIDMADVDLGNAIHLSGLSLPEGVTIPSLGTGDDTSRDLPVVSVSLIIVQEDEVEEEDEVDAELEDQAEDTGETDSSSESSDSEES